MKFSVCSYSFSRLIQNGTLNQFTCIAMAKKMGFDAIEFVDILPHDGSSRETYAACLRQEADRLGLFISNYAVNADFLLGSQGDCAAEIKRVKKEVDLAALLGAPRMRHDATTGYPPDSPAYCSFESVLDKLATACREVTEYAQAKGIRTMVENHGFFCQDSERLEKLYVKVAHPNFSLLLDMGNFLCADEDPAQACTRIAPFVTYAHAKDFHFKAFSEADPGEGYWLSRGGNHLRGAIIGHGQVPVRQCLFALKRAGYDDTIALEFEGMEDPLQAIAIGLANLKRYWADQAEK